jgi:hypothetical protein
MINLKEKYDNEITFFDSARDGIYLQATMPKSDSLDKISKQSFYQGNIWRQTTVFTILKTL